MYKIQTLNKISSSGLSVLDGAGFVISDNESAPDAIIVRSTSMHDTELPESLLAIARAGAGVNNIPIDKCSGKGIVVFNTPGANANAVKELIIAGLLLSSRKVCQGINWAGNLQGQPDVPKLVEKGKSNFGGNEITGKTLGIIGVSGAIGSITAKACYALGMNVVGYCRNVTEKVKSSVPAEVSLTSDISDIFAQSDYISLNAAYNSETKYIINAETLAKCKKDVVILNFARGELVNDAAIKDAISEGRVACYITDFPNEELLNTEGIITIPHLGASTEESEENCAKMASVQIKDYLEKGNITNSVNFPELSCDLPGKRICVSFRKNDDNYVCSGIKNILSGKGLTFEFFSAMRNDLGYSAAVITAGDIDGVCGEIRNLPGVLAVRELEG